jgi:hypothetical protein
MSNFFEGINNLYTRKGYFDLYGGSFITMLIVMSTFFIFFSYYWILSNRTDIKQNWDSMKCHPGIIPFAGFINAPEGVNKTEYTKENFAGCFFNILKNITKVFTAPIQIIYNVLLNFFMTLSNSVNNIRKIQEFFLGILGLQFEGTMKRTYGALIPLVIVFEKIAIVFKKMGAILLVFYYKLISIFKITINIIQLILDICKAILKIALAVLLVLWSVAWFIPPVAALATIGTAIYIVLLIIFILASNVLKLMFKDLNINVMGIAGTRDNDELIGKSEN